MNHCVLISCCLLGKELKEAIVDWQKRHNEKDLISTGFLDGASPIVDIYELKLRLSHVLRRLRFLQDSHATEPPSQVLDYLYVGNALSSQGIHLLRHIGITHIINATKVSHSWSIPRGTFDHERSWKCIHKAVEWNVLGFQ